MGITRTSGAKTLTASGALISSGEPIRVWSVHFTSGATAGVIQLYNNTSATGTPVISETGTANRSKSVNYENGLLFPDGCYVEFVTATSPSAAVIECSMEV